MSAQDTIQPTLEAQLERVFLQAESPDWLERTGSLYQTNLQSQTLEILHIYALFSGCRDLESNQPQVALQLCELARERSQHLGYAAGLAWYWREAGSIHHTLGSLQTAEEYLHRAIEEFTPLGIRVGIASSLNILGHVAAINGRLEESIRLYREYVQVSHELGRTESEAIGLANIAETHLDLGQPWRALEVLLESKRALEELQFNPAASAWTLGLIGRAYRDLGDVKNALTCLIKTRDLNQTSNDLHCESGTLAQIAEIHKSNGDLELASEALNQAMRLNATHGDQSQRAHLLNTQAELQRLENQPQAARQSVTQALEIALKNNNRVAEINALIEFAALEPEREITHLKRALEISQEISTPQHSAKIHGILCEKYRQSGRHSLALEHLGAQRQIEQNLQRSETEHRIRNLSIQFEINQAERETQHERQRNQALEIANLENTRLLETLRLQTEQLERLANEDALTGLANRRTLEHLLPREIERARRYKHPIGVVFADIDHFKLVNDRFGHAVGDQVLKRVAQVLLEHCRLTDVVARFGGEEFVLVLPEIHLENTIELCERIRAHIQTNDWNSIRPGLQITMSFGINANTELDAHMMLDAADTQLYSAKQRGRNRVAWQPA